MSRFVFVMSKSRYGTSLACVLLVAVWTGCFSEQSFPLRVGDVVRVSPPRAAPERLTVRPWLTRTHAQLRHLLPWGKSDAMTTEAMREPTGKPADVTARFHLKPDQLDQLLCNYDGLAHSAQVSGSNYDPSKEKMEWEGYEQVWIPISPTQSLCGRLGYSRQDDKTRDADCIVLLPGLLGHNSIHRTRHLAEALCQFGHHVLAVESRGHGDTDRRYPALHYNFGVLETDDLLVISEWLQAQPHIRDTGLIGFCWGANLGLLAAWRDATDNYHPSINERLRPHLRTFSNGEHYRAGIIAFSPVLRFEEIIEDTAIPRTSWRNPVLAALQSTIRQRMVMKGHANPNGSLRNLIDAEYAHTVLSYPGAVEEGLDFLRLHPHRGRTDGQKLRTCRMPVLIVHGANDPLSPAEDVAELLTQTPNPNLAAIILSGGGHVGFAAFARSYYYSLIMNFFDKESGPVPCPVEPTRPSAQLRTVNNRSE